MPVYTLYTLPESELTISGGAVLDGVTQGTGEHLVGETITLNSNSWQTIQIDDDDANFDDNDTGQTLDGAATVDGITFPDGRVIEAEYTLTVQDPDGNSYTIIGYNIRAASGDPSSYSTIEGLAFIGPVGGFPPVGVPLTVVSNAEGPSGTTTYASYATPPCFTAGARIETPSGAVAIETLRPGDIVITAEGPRPVRWIGQRRIVAPRGRLAPVVFARGSIAPGVPVRETRLSPQHRVLLDGPQCELLFAAPEVLVPAIHLVNGSTIRQDEAMAEVTYVHLMLDSHTTLTVDGMRSESLLPGRAIEGLPRAAREEIEAIFPGILADPGRYGATAAPCLKGFEAKALREALETAI
ncbi:MAG: Hint domain-containing protein [Rubricella sp.]